LLNNILKLCVDDFILNPFDENVRGVDAPIESFATPIQRSLPLKYSLSGRLTDKNIPFKTVSALAWIFSATFTLPPHLSFTVSLK
jgi:hypothetical protein